MIIRKATIEDIPGIEMLLTQVCLVHHHGRPDLFQYGKRKYTAEELKLLLENDLCPIFVAADTTGNVFAHAFCIHQEFKDHNVLTGIKTLYIDDLCVSETCRNQQIGKKMVEYIQEYAKNNGYYNITLNVWSFNSAALGFYESCGFSTQKLGLELIL